MLGMLSVHAGEPPPRPPPPQSTAQVGLELTFLLTQPPECWDYNTPSRPASVFEGRDSGAPSFT